jgi:hypothetical protein
VICIFHLHNPFHMSPPIQHPSLIYLTLFNKNYET